MRELLFVFQDVEGPRRDNAKRHDLHDILVVALLTVLTGGRTCVDMEDLGHQREEWLRQYSGRAQAYDCCSPPPSRALRARIGRSMAR